MALTVKCRCGAALAVTAGMAGRMGTCPRCGRTMLIPKAVASHAAAEDAQSADSTTEGEALRPVNVHWPSLAPGFLVMAGMGLTVIIAVVAAAIFVLPAPPKDSTARAAAVDYVNPRHGYRLVVPEAWRIADDNPDNLVLQGRTDSAEMTVSVRRGTESMNESAAALRREAEREPGFADYDWKCADIYGYPTFQITYSYSKDWRALARTFRAGEKWLVITFRASAPDFPRDMREFEDVCRSIKMAE